MCPQFPAKLTGLRGMASRDKRFGAYSLTAVFCALWLLEARVIGNSVIAHPENTLLAMGFLAYLIIGGVITGFLPSFLIGCSDNGYDETTDDITGEKL